MENQEITEENVSKNAILDPKMLTQENFERILSENNKVSTLF